MTNIPSEQRRTVAAKALAYKNGEISWKAFMDEGRNLPDLESDELLDELISEIEHEPQRGGFFGLNEKQWMEYERHIYQLIDELSK
ncbi:MAG: hypothetical protein ACYDBB_21740 [Armatimonadota bacterium]